MTRDELRKATSLLAQAYAADWHSKTLAAEVDALKAQLAETQKLGSECADALLSAVQQLDRQAEAMSAASERAERKSMIGTLYRKEASIREAIGERDEERQRANEYCTGECMRLRATIAELQSHADDSTTEYNALRLEDAKRHFEDAKRHYAEIDALRAALKEVAGIAHQKTFRVDANARCLCNQRGSHCGSCLARCNEVDAMNRRVRELLEAAGVANESR